MAPTKAKAKQGKEILYSFSFGRQPCSSVSVSSELRRSNIIHGCNVLLQGDIKEQAHRSLNQCSILRDFKVTWRYFQESKRHCLLQHLLILLTICFYLQSLHSHKTLIAKYRIFPCKDLTALPTPRKIWIFCLINDDGVCVLRSLCQSLAMTMAQPHECFLQFCSTGTKCNKGLNWAHGWKADCGWERG